MERVPEREDEESDHVDFSTEPSALCCSSMPPLVDQGPEPFMEELLDSDERVVVPPVRWVVCDEELELLVVVPVPEDWCELVYSASATPPSMELDDEELPEYVPIPLLLVFVEKLMREIASDDDVVPDAVKACEDCDIFMPLKLELVWVDATYTADPPGR